MKSCDTIERWLGFSVRVRPTSYVARAAAFAASSSAPAWTVIPTVASSIAALAALITVGQAVSYRNETRRQTLADAIIAAVSATELDLAPDESGYTNWQRRVADAGRQLDRAIVHSLLGFVSRNDITETMTKMMEPAAKDEPHLMFRLGT